MSGIKQMKQQIIRRIIIRSIIVGCWIVGLGIIVAQGAQELGQGTYLYMMVALAAVWIVYFIRDFRFLKDEERLQRASIEHNDERTVLITYKATRLAVAITLSLVPIAMCVLAFMDMQPIINALAIVVAVFAAAYLICWFVISRRS